MSQKNLRHIRSPTFSRDSFNVFMSKHLIFLRQKVTVELNNCILRDFSSAVRLHLWSTDSQSHQAHWCCCSKQDSTGQSLQSIDHLVWNSESPSSRMVDNQVYIAGLNHSLIDFFISRETHQTFFLCGLNCYSKRTFRRLRGLFLFIFIALTILSF